MTEQTAQEPTMEEILASIRRIISEDDAPAETSEAVEEAPVVEPEPEPVTFAAEPEEEVLELTEPYEAPAAEVIGDLDVSAPVYEPEPEPVVQDFPVTDDALVSESTAAEAASAFAGLAAVGRPSSAPTAQDMPFDSGNTVEGMVRDMLRPMLKNWLDTNLPAIVEREVRKEVERIARSAS
ncbi:MULTISPECIES: DUF2497 domain-containing protein [unclassified Brevundimonas]|uniref:DUF2497 domain-containing protein n=1 Tax=unclassified Brevundimonas TaxID=2622653 RepID=UPI0025C291DF|nr:MULTISPECIES: DUF2497 domain-containing protein [unclassified Brevundimonas]